ncbi:DET1 homolog, partial [Hyalella azteca]|uniref:DET1 homolog n=1 Tax=Hyalella azteca TaxID=294128 RepID=A0A8B7NII9_HYAAZ
YLIAFSADQTCVEIYNYRGALAANELLSNCPIPVGDTVLHSDVPLVAHVLNRIFDCFFRLRSSVHVAGSLEQLNRECSVFSTDCRFLIVGCSSTRDPSGNSRLADAYRYNESLTPNPRAPLDDYSIYVINLELGIVMDSISFKNDKLFLSHNQCMSLYKQTLVILSTQHQTLHRYHLGTDGKLTLIQNIGRTCFADDDVLLNSCVAHDCAHLSNMTQPIRTAEENLELNNFEGNNFDMDQDDRENAASAEEQASTLFNLLSSFDSSYVSTSQANSNIPASSAATSRPSSSDGSVQGPSSSSSASSSFSQASSLFSTPPWPGGTSLFPLLTPQRSAGGPPVFGPPPTSGAGTSRSAAPQHDHKEGPYIIYSLKHRLLTFLHRVAETQCRQRGSNEPMRLFCASFDNFLNLRMVKMQLLDEEHLFIKYGSEDLATQRTSEPGVKPFYFALYNMNTTEIIGVYEGSSKQMMSIYERYTDFFRNPRLPCEPNSACSPANNIHSRLMLERQKATWTSIRSGSAREAYKRILVQLPVPCQNHSCSPYLDLSLFNYLDKCVSVIERPKATTDQPIRFYGRKSGLLKFTLDVGTRSGIGAHSSVPPRRLVAFYFHPTDPFAVSVQKYHDDYVVNFHVRHHPT